MSEIMEFLRSGGYRSAETAQNTALSRRKFYLRGDGEADRHRPLFGDFSGFETEESDDAVLVRFVGPADLETGTLLGYTHVLKNCGFPVEPTEDPQREGRRALQVTPRG